MTETRTTRPSETEEIATTTVGWVLAAMFAFFGASKLAGADAQVAMFESWGYPLWFMYVVGAAEVASAAALLARRTAFFGATLVVGLMVGGAATHVAAGQLLQTPLPIVTASAAALVAVLRRPAWLTLAGPHESSTEVGDSA